MNRLPIPEDELLRYALIGYQQRLSEIAALMRDIETQLRERGYVDRIKHFYPGPVPAGVDGSQPRRRISRKGRAAIAAAQRERWARIHKAQRKRKISPEGLANIRAAAKKRWAKVHKEEGRA